MNSLSGNDNNSINSDISEQDIENVMALLDNCLEKGEGRFKVTMSDSEPKGETKKQYHLGRCDVGSPWAKGQAFDVNERAENRFAGEIEDVTDITGKRLGGENAYFCG